MGKHDSSFVASLFGFTQRFDEEGFKASVYTSRHATETRRSEEGENGKKEPQSAV